MIGFGGLRGIRQMMNVLPPRRPPGRLEREPVYIYVQVDDGGAPVGPFDSCWQAMICGEWIEQNGHGYAEVVIATLEALNVDARGIWRGEADR